MRRRSMARKSPQATETETMSRKAAAHMAEQEWREPSCASSDFAYALSRSDEAAVLAYNRKRIQAAFRLANAAFAENDYRGLHKAVSLIHLILTGTAYKLNHKRRAPWRKRGDDNPMPYADAFRVFDRYVPQYEADVTAAVYACGEVLDALYVWFNSEI